MLALCQHNTLAYYAGIFDAGLGVNIQIFGERLTPRLMSFSFRMEKSWWIMF